MESLLVLFPGVLLIDVAWCAYYLRDRRLVALLRARHPDVFITLRGRERRWCDASEELWVQQPAIRRQLRGLLEPRLAADPALAAALADVERGQWWVRRAAWVAVASTALFIAALVTRYRLTGGH